MRRTLNDAEIVLISAATGKSFQFQSSRSAVLITDCDGQRLEETSSQMQARDKILFYFYSVIINNKWPFICCVPYVLHPHD